MAGRWINMGQLQVNKTWNISGFSLGSPIIRVSHNISFEQGQLHRGVFALTDRQSGKNSLIAAQRIFPSSGSEILVFPTISDLRNVGCAVREYKGPLKKSWRWTISVAYWADFSDLVDERLEDLNNKVDDALTILNMLLGLLP